MLTLMASAKINLALHVVGRRADGYHLLDSLVTFADVGDFLSAKLALELTLDVTGPYGSELGSGEDNLVMRAARLMQSEAADLGAGRPGAALTLIKFLPVASGLGGGSADAAETMHVLNMLWDLELTLERLQQFGLDLGADVPMCLAGKPARVEGIGEKVTPIGPLPGMALVLVNPGVPVSTPDVFRALAKRDHPPLPTLPASWEGLDHLVDWLRSTRNDLEAPAIGIAPAIGDVLQTLAATPGCLLARMSGSGATCFGIFPDRNAAERAAATIRAAHLDWWVET